MEVMETRQPGERTNSSRQRGERAPVVFAFMTSNKKNRKANSSVGNGKEINFKRVYPRLKKPVYTH